MEIAIRIGVPVAIIVFVALFFLSYKKIWTTTIGEPWTYHVRRNSWYSIPIALVAFAGLIANLVFTPWWLSARRSPPVNV